MDFRTDKTFLELVAAHKAGLRLARGCGNAPAYQRQVMKQLTLQKRLLRKYEVSFCELHGATVRAA
jgi:hypothetical protein